ncbi:hypothetical protein B0T19DRAFT_453106 [Cercophora scortea]|uniref:Uncharacterized protein n=1 Tax=Cercophora scortea TaxID=314031 RepID=A0AAE0MKF5_9PEZI|nr:hypothetical protein B0T19DRAFT_453106 [Cercophora scortea]
MGIKSFFKKTIAPAGPPAAPKKPTPNKAAEHHTSAPAKMNPCLAIKQGKLRQTFQSSEPSSQADELTRLRLLSKPLPPRPGQLSAKLLAEMLDRIDRSLGHTRYVVGGLAALAVWGFAEDFPSHITIHCPEGDVGNIRTWARTSGWVLYSNSPDTLGLPTSDRSIRTVSIKCVSEERFAQMDSMSPASVMVCGPEMIETHANVLTLPALLDQFSGLYTDIMARSANPDEEGPLARSTARLILWILRRLDYRLSGETFMAEDVPRVVDQSFWVPFTARHPEAPALFGCCGLGGLPLFFDLSEIVYEDERGEGSAVHAREQPEAVYSHDASGPLPYPFRPLSVASTRV